MIYSDRILLDYLREKQGDMPEVTIRHSAIVADTGISIATVKRGLRRLEGVEKISKRGKKGFECTYNVTK